MSQLTPPLVYQGFWINHAHGTILGSTITTKLETTNILVAVLSVLIAFAGSHLWDILAFLYFSLYTTKSPRDGLHHQRQFLLRNIASPAAVSWYTIKMMWQWRNTSTRPLARLIGLAIVTGVCSAGFIVAGILASQIISTTGLEVLAQSDACGFFNNLDTGNITQATRLVAYTAAAVEESITYTARCFNGSAADPACQIYTKQQTPVHQSYVSCPFDDDLCTLQTNQALRMDTGLLWSNDMFGINTKSENALAIRKVTTCAPLNVSQYQNYSRIDAIHSRQYGRDPLPNELMINWWLGSWYNSPQKDTFFASSVNTNSSLRYSNAMVNWHATADEAFQETPWRHALTIDPIRPLARNDSDLYLMLIGSNLKSYAKPVDDPIFAAHTPLVATTFNGNGTITNITMFRADDAGRVLGCTEQFQFCTSETSCTILSDSMSASQAAAKMNLTPLQNVTLYLFSYVLHGSGLVSLQVLNYASEFPMRAKLGRLVNGEGLLPNQWEIEVNYWNAIILETIHKEVTDYAVGQKAAGLDYGPLLRFSRGPYEHVLCHAQKMMAPGGFGNISVLGLSFTISLSVLIIVINMFLTRLFRCVIRRRGRHRDFVEQWDRQELLQFQRIAYGQCGIGSWTGKLHRVPITKNNEVFECLTQHAVVSDKSQNFTASRQDSSGSVTVTVASDQSDADKSQARSIERSYTL